MAWMTPAEAAEKIHVPADRLKYWRASGRGPSFFRPSHKTVLYDSEVLEQFIASSIRKPSVQAFMEERNGTR